MLNGRVLFDSEQHINLPANSVMWDISFRVMRCSEYDRGREYIVRRRCAQGRKRTITSQLIADFQLTGSRKSAVAVSGGQQQRLRWHGSGKQTESFFLTNRFPRGYASALADGAGDYHCDRTVRWFGSFGFSQTGRSISDVQKACGVFDWKIDVMDTKYVFWTIKNKERSHPDGAKIFPAHKNR